jgi:hypothetical protein
MSAGFWADSDRGQRSVAAIASIELPPEPVAVRESKPAVAKPVAAASDDWDVPEHRKTTPVDPEKIPSATKPPPKKEPADPGPESWGPTAKGISKSAEFGSEPEAYRWLQGRVSFVKIGGDRVWKIRFAPYDKVDKYGGSFVLEGALPSNLKEGDLVRVEGFPANGQADARSARYNCMRVSVLKRADQK